MKTWAIVIFQLIGSLTIIGKTPIYSHAKSNLLFQKTALQDTTYIIQLNKKAEEFRYQRSDSIGFYADKALELSEKLGYEKGIVHATSNLALHELYQGNTENAITINQQNVSEYDLMRFPDLAIKIYNDLAQAYFIKAEYPQSYRHFLTALDYADTSQNQNELVRINSNLGTMFSLLEDYEEGLNHYRMAQNNVTQDTPPHVVGAILANLGYVRLRKGSYEEALADLKKGLRYLENSEFSTLKAFTLLNLGETYAETDEFDSALKFYERAQKEYQKNKDKKGTADLYNALSSLYLELGDYPQSLSFAKQGLDLYTAFNLKTGMERCYRTMYELFKKQKVLDSSLYYLELAENFSDSIAKTKNKTNIAMLRSKMEIEAEKEKTMRADLLTIAQQKQYIRWVTAFLVIAIALVAFIFQANKRKKELNHSLAEKAKVLSENEKILSESNSTKDKLFSIIGHDLRGPVTSLRELVTLSLEDDKVGESYYRKYAPGLNKKLDHLQFTLDNLLNWGQTQMSGASVNPNNLWVHNEINDSIALFREKFAEKSIRINNKVPKDSKIFADTNHFAIIIRNLLSNAIKFTHENGTVDINVHETAGSILISVADNGIGMDQDTLDKVWHNQKHHTTYGTSMEKGTGLGLSLCKEMIEKNHGQMTVDSKPGKGTTFYLEFPSVPQNT